jgi:hypothetical protein
MCSGETVPSDLLVLLLFGAPPILVFAALLLSAVLTFAGLEISVIYDWLPILVCYKVNENKPPPLPDH